MSHLVGMKHIFVSLAIIKLTHLFQNEYKQLKKVLKRNIEYDCILGKIRVTTDTVVAVPLVVCFCVQWLL